ncbi:MAG TPA: archease [bacterium]|nr:archease [bacterium]
MSSERRRTGPRPFETFEHTADIGLIARGRTLRALYVNAAHGLVSLIVDPRGLREAVVERITVSASNRETLLVVWLNEILYLLDARRFLPRRCRVTSLTDTALEADLVGEAFDERRHTPRRLVKAATYHNLELTRIAGGWEARILLDV